MKLRKVLAVLFAAAFLFLAVCPVAVADDYDLTWKRTNQMGTSSATASGDKIVVWDASANAWKTMDAYNPTIGQDVTFRANLLSIGRKNGVSTMSSSSTAIDPLNGAYVVYMKHAGGNNCKGEIDGGTRLPDGTPGQVIVCFLQALDTNGSWIITPDTSTTFASVTLATAGEHVTLLFVNSTIGWMIWSNEGGAVGLVTSTSLGFE